MWDEMSQRMAGNCGVRNYAQVSLGHVFAQVDSKSFQTEKKQIKLTQQVWQLTGFGHQFV
jgi:hypothetical protein